MEDNYIVSALKYRPSTFQSVIGQSALTTTLKNAIANNHLAHAYLFCGPRGVGKTTCARIFAKTINCLSPTEEGEACNECESCTGFNEQRSYNIHELDAASNNSVDDIRNLVEQVRIPPQVGKYSVFIIDEVHMLTTAAFNAFLKTLEEPPSHVIFILATTEKHKIIPTILSRCQIYDFNRISVQDTMNHLEYVAKNEGVTVELEALNVIAQKSDGGMRDALSIFDQVVNFCGNDIKYKEVIANLNVLDYDYYFRLIDCFLQGDVSQSLLIFDEVLNKGFEGMHFIGGLATHLRNVMVSRDPMTVRLLEVGASIAERYKEQASLCENPFLYRAIELTSICDQKYKESRNKRLLVELTLIQLCSILHPVNPKPSKKTVMQALVASTDTKSESLKTAPAVVVSTHTAPKVVIKPKEQPIFSKVVTQSSTSVVASTKSSTEVVARKVPVRGHHMSTVSVKRKSSAKPVVYSQKDQLQSGVACENPASQHFSKESTKEIGNDPIDEFKMGQLWMEFAEKIKSEAYTSQILRGNIPQIVGVSELKLELQNDIQIKRLRAYKKEIEAFLEVSLNHKGLKIEFTIDPSATKHKFLTPEETLESLELKYEDFGGFVKKMALRL